MNKLFVKPAVVETTDDPTKTYQIILPYLGVFTRRVEKKMKQALKEHLPNTKVTVVYRAATRLRALFAFKDKIPPYIRSGVIYTSIHATAARLFISAKLADTRKPDSVSISEFLL